MFFLEFYPLFSYLFYAYFLVVFGFFSYLFIFISLSCLFDLAPSVADLRSRVRPGGHSNQTHKSLSLDNTDHCCKHCHCNGGERLSTESSEATSTCPLTFSFTFCSPAPYHPLDSSSKISSFFTLLSFWYFFLSIDATFYFLILALHQIIFFFDFEFWSSLLYCTDSYFFPPDSLMIFWPSG